TDYLINQVYSFFRKWKVEPPSVGSMKRMIDSAIHTFEQKLYQGTYQHLSAQTCNHIDELLESHDYQEGYKENLNSVTFRQLLSSPHKPSVATMEIELKKLLTIRHLHIPNGLFHHLSPKLIKKYQIRAATETITELRAHPASIRYTILAILFSYRQSEIIDNLADLLDEITHKFEKKAKNTT
ncbi:Tn3 family transposase, partial [Bacillus thuringiensis]|nr:Tn3 family transposase [Bacillus thuringiensis]